MKETLAWSEYCKSLVPEISEACTKAPTHAGPAGLVKALGAGLPDWKFRHLLVRGGWYRLGGIVDGGGARLADNLEAWIEAALEARDGDIGGLIDDFADRELYATRLAGQTHYLVAGVGAGQDDFLQLEIEEFQEVRAHRLFQEDAGSIEELADPRSTSAGTRPLGLPFYRFRRIQHIGAFLKRMLAQKPEPAPIHRLLADWSRSSAGHASAFSNHWVIATREHEDRYHQPVLQAQPIPVRAGEAPAFTAPPGAQGLALSGPLTQFDRSAGYPMAWFFHLLSGKAVPHWVAQTVVEDALAGFAYLPQRDVDVVRGWLHRPYAV